MSDPVLKAAQEGWRAALDQRDALVALIRNVHGNLLDDRISDILRGTDQPSDAPTRPKTLDYICSDCSCRPVDMGTWYACLCGRVADPTSDDDDDPSGEQAGTYIFGDEDD